MKSAPDKLKMSITLDEYTAQLLREAVKLAMPDSEKYGEEKQDRHRMVHLALMSFLRAVIKAKGRIVYPVMVDLRAETSSEMIERLAGKMPGQTNSEAAHAALAAKNEELAARIRGMNSDEVGAMIGDFEMILNAVRGCVEEIPENSKPLAAKFTAELFAMDETERAEYAEGVEQDIADLREYLEFSPAAPELSAAELRYCQAEGIKPEDFLKAKSRQ
jgi:hypothetical protein